MDDHAAGFVDHNDVIIFEHNGKGNFLRLRRQLFFTGISALIWSPAATAYDAFVHTAPFTVTEPASISRFTWLRDVNGSPSEAK